MSFLEGNCIATLTVQNNTHSAVTLTQGGVYQMTFNGLPLTVQPGQSGSFGVWAEQGSDFPGDDSGTINCAFANGVSATIQWQGQGVSSGEAPMAALGWTINPGNSGIQARMGILVNTDGNTELLSDVVEKCGDIVSSDGVEAGAETAAESAGIGEALAAALPEILTAAATLGIDWLIAGSEDGVQLSGATNILLGN